MVLEITNPTLLSELWVFFSIMASSKEDSSCSDFAILLLVPKRPRGSPPYDVKWPPRGPQVHSAGVVDQQRRPGNEKASSCTTHQYTHV